MSTLLAENSYGKSRVRLVKVTRRRDRHDLQELTVHVRFEGDYDSSYTSGDNSDVLPTDTMKNTVYALARKHGVDTIEGFGRALAEHFLAGNPRLARVRIAITEHLWTHLAGTAFLRNGGEKRVAAVTVSRQGASVEAGIEDLVIMKTAGSAFEGFMRDPLTTLPDTQDRLLGTSLAAMWTYTGNEIPWGLSWHGVRKTLLDAFAEHQSRSVQHTLFAMGEAVLESHADVAEIRLSMPNKHCLLVDLAPFGLENPNEIFLPVDEPHGLIEARLVRRP
jgi:urate oxidase